MKIAATVLAACLALAPFAAGAQSYRCTGKDGKKYYGQSVPPQCAGQPIEQLNAQGLVVKKIDAQATADARAKMEAEDAERKKREAVSKEEGRRDRALLATYTSEKDIEEQRGRALADNQKAVVEQEARVAELKKRRAGFDKELEFYQDKKGVTKVPPKLTEEIRQVEFDLKVQQEALEAKRKEVNNINAKYDEDKKRFAALTKR